MQAWKAGEEVSDEIVWVDSIQRNNGEHPRTIVRELFSMSPSASDESVFNTVALPNGDAAVVALTEVSPGSTDDSQLDELKSQMRNRQAQVMLQAFINNFKSGRRYKTFINSVDVDIAKKAQTVTSLSLFYFYCSEFIRYCCTSLATRL